MLTKGVCLKHENIWYYFKEGIQKSTWTLLDLKKQKSQLKAERFSMSFALSLSRLKIITYFQFDSK